MPVRLALLLALLLPLTTRTPRAAGGASDRQTIIGQAAVRLAHARTRSVLAWLRQRPGVASASLGRDGRTVDIWFTDGTEGAILPQVPSERGGMVATRLPRPMVRVDGSSAAHAIVLEPFASELNLGSSAGTPESDALRASGFSVDEAYDTDVSVSLMSTLSHYSVVYILTHSGVNAQGEGVIATGEVANPDPNVKPLLDDHTVIIVGIAGSDTKYYGVLSGYFSEHVGRFPPNSLVFVNGCSILRGTLVWGALAAQGVRAMVSWDNESAAPDDGTAGQQFFDELAAGETVAGAVSRVVSAGHGVSVIGGTAAHFGYVGDGDFTLHDVLDPPTATPVPSPTPTASPSAAPTTPTATPARRHRARWPEPLPWRTVAGMADRP